MTELKSLDVCPHDQGEQSSLSVGDWVEVRSKDEILATLNKNGKLEELPFMPEMFAFCGKRFRVYRRAHKTCDTVNDYKGRKMKDSVHLDGLRCNGQAHGGCEAACLIFWKTAWLRPLDADGQYLDANDGKGTASRGNAQGCTEADVIAATQKPLPSLVTEIEPPAYVCQATQVPAATEPLSGWDMRQYIEDYRSGNVSLGMLCRGGLFMTYLHIINLGIGLGAPLRWLYEQFRPLWRGVPYPLKPGKLPRGGPTPVAKLGLQEGDLVRVKSHQEILATCDENLINRGMSFDKEMVPYCGGTYRVLRRVTRIINERTGKMQEMKNPCIILEGVVCQARYSSCRLFCPRSIYPYWREIWLERVPNGSELKKETISISPVREDSQLTQAEQVLR